MKKSKAVKLIEKVALREGVSVEEVRRDMIAAIDIAYKNRGDEAFWQRWNGRKPTLEEFLVAVNQETLTRLNFGE
ncbi:MAG: hypothetical protein FWF76_02890 [Oscillospiraceae bacterium]|nr:hypothetical protein [Oscillospiraceae bacterium]